MRILKFSLGILAGLLLLLVVIYYADVRIVDPLSQDELAEVPEVKQVSEHHFEAGHNWLKQNDKGLWELYLEGPAYERGLAFGALASELQLQKEEAFIGEIRNRIPSESYLGFLKYVVGWFNRDLDDFVPREYLLEIYGSSRRMPDKFDFVAPKFHRALSYHAAHDIGHALQNMNLVGCTAFASWGEESVDGKLYIGRNFDFYFGEDFARDKIVAFYKPEEGYQFMSVTWAGFSGVVSGMNEKGLTVTLNSAKAEIPTKGKTPVSLIARQILQYASNIQEAYDIAASFDSFVAETFLIGSKEDGRVGLIEKSPGKTAIVYSPRERLITTNHFQSEELIGDEHNQEYMREEVSGYRAKRVYQLMDEMKPLNPQKVADILRDKNGIHNADIGLGNEKAINQLIAHHSVIFSPEDMIAWVSAAPYQLGDYVAYDLNKIFSGEKSGSHNLVYDDSLSIPADPFLQTEAYRQYEVFAKTRDRIQHYLLTGKGEPLSEQEVKAFEESNPNGYLTYYYLGEYFKNKKDYARARVYYENGLHTEIARTSERMHMLEGMNYCKQQLEND